MRKAQYKSNLETAKFFSQLSFLLSLPHFTKVSILSLLGQYPMLAYQRVVRNYSQLHNMSDFSNLKSNKKTFKFIHNSLTHTPWMVDKNCNIAYEVFNGYQGSFNAGYCSIKFLINFFIKLKKLGIYNKTKIIIVSDHGAFYGNTKIKTKKFQISEGSASALMLVKDFNQSGNLKTSMQFLSNIDTYGIALSGVSEGVEVKLDKIKTKEENRSLIFIKENHPLQTYNIVEAFRIKNNIFDEKNWQEVSGEQIDISPTEN